MYCGLKQAADALRAPYVSRESLLRATLAEIDAGSLDTSVPRGDAASATIRLAGMFCRWVEDLRSVQVPELGDRTPGALPKHSLSLIRLANKVGQPHLSKIVYERVHQVVKLYDPLNKDSFDFELQAAKAARLLGEHAMAISTYRRLLEHSGVASPIQIPKVLLNLGKMSHSYEWRTGLYLQLAKIAETHFRALMTDETVDIVELKRQIAICIDCQCQTELEINDGSESAAILYRWKQALSLCDSPFSQNSYRRILLRCTYAEFQRTTDGAAWQSLLEKYSRYLGEIELQPDEGRGLAVRYGQYAEMLAEVGRLEDSKEYLDAAIEFARDISDWRALANNTIRKSAVQLRYKLDRRSDDLDLLAMALTRLRANHAKVPTDVEVAVLRQQARHYSALGDALSARRCLDEVMEKLEDFERRILRESTGEFRATDSPSIVQVLDSVLQPAEHRQVRDAGMVDYTVLSRFERSVINELLDAITLDVRHLGSKQTVSLSRLAVSTVLHDQRARIDRLLSELRGDYVREFDKDESNLSRVLQHLELASERVRSDLNADLERFTPRADIRLSRRHEEPIAISKAFKMAFERGRFATRYSDIDFQIPVDEPLDFAIGIDADVLITVLDNLLQNAATAASARSAEGRRYVKVCWDWRENAAQLNPMAYIQVEDSGGAVDRLRDGLASGAPGRFGLKLAKIFFDALRGEMSADGIQGQRTVLAIELQASEIVRLL